ncbi:tapasin-related protein-like isoform X1 [Astyanax mexicanus]|uniref:Tapasin-related protein-like isoform X1 n=1 Tax=Astyanax mexicanus TaxID=7994 RepID=A0A8T2LW75_ASTMX|nr:tapasin-related protein-like isoform X1 [Astyanax mexicanus]
MLEVLVFACLQALAHSLQGADVVLSCSFIEEGGGMMGGSLFTRTPATLVLRDLVMTSDPSQDTVTPYNPPDTPNADDLIFEVTVLSVEIPEAESLLHADCNEQEVVCELSRYVPRGTEPDALPAHFISSIQIEGGGVGLTLLLQTISNEEAESNVPPLMQSKLQLPLSQWGTLLTEAVFVVFSRSPSLAAPLGDDALLDCGYRQKDTSQNQDVGLEWRWQYKGNGKRILEIKAQGVDSEEGTQVVHKEREGVSADSVLLIRDGNASLTMKKLKVSDEGTYICTISTGAFQTQQIIQLHITKPPNVFLTEKKVMFQDESPQKLSCHCERYYPLDVHVEWISQTPSETEAISLTEKASLSSHRQHSDGTFSLSSFLFIRPSEHPPGTVLTCRVSHFALQTPSDVSLTVDPPEPAGNYYWMVLATLILSALFLYQASR